MRTDTFENYLEDVHADDYHGTDDDMPDAYESWLERLEIEDLLEYAEDFGKKLNKKIKELSKNE